MSTTAMVEYCVRCGRRLGSHSVILSGHVGKFHAECAAQMMTMADRNAMAAAPIFVAPHDVPGEAKDMPEVATWRPVLTFPDQSQSFTFGFEAGILWQKLAVLGGLAFLSADPELIHTANRALVRSMADQHQLDVEFTDLQGEWSMVRFVQRRGKGGFGVVEGGKNDG